MDDAKACRLRLGLVPVATRRSRQRIPVIRRVAAAQHLLEYGVGIGFVPTGHGIHATPSEIAVTQWAYPACIKTADYAPQVANWGPIREALDFRARHPDGRMGSDPGQASPEKGRQLVMMAVQGLVKVVDQFTSEPTPA